MTMTVCPQHIDQAIIEVLLLWLRQDYNVQRYGPPTWRRLVEAVDRGNNFALAIHIASRHLLPGMFLSTCRCDLKNREAGL